MQRKKASSLENFQTFYAEQFDEDWPSIFESLKLPPQHCAVINKFSAHKETHEKLSSVAAKLHNIPPFQSTSNEHGQNLYQLPCYLPVSENVRFPKQGETSNGYFDYYLLDASSLLPVLALDVHPESTVLDMCAAPGGKSVLISQFLSTKGCLVTSEVANHRRANLIKVGLIVEYYHNRMITPPKVNMFSLVQFLSIGTFCGREGEYSTKLFTGKLCP